jgi:hypothetical protein
MFIFTQTGGVSGPPSGYVAWYDMSDSLTYDGSNNVSVCADKGSNGFNATQSTGSAQPVRISSALNNKDVIELTTGSQYLDFGATRILDAQSAWTISVTALRSSSGGGIYPGLLLIKDGNGSRNFSLYCNDGESGSPFHINNPNWGLKWSEAQPTRDTWFNLLMTYNGGGLTTDSNYTAYLNFSSLTLAGSAETPPTNRNQLSNLGGTGWNGRIAEVICWQSVLSAGQISRQQTYHLAKWGF